MQKFRELPFHWFCSTYLTRANILLNLDEFHATNFYKYLAESLLGDSNTIGCFKLIVNRTDLTDLAWEELQIFGTKQKVPLIEKELQLMKTVYSLLPGTGLHSLNMRWLKTVTSDLEPRNLFRFFGLHEDQWVPWFSKSAMGLKRYYVHFQLSKFTSLKDFIDFQDQENTTLCNSRLYRYINFEKTYSGYLVIPDHNEHLLLEYLQRCDYNRQLILYELTEATDIYTSMSFALYQPKKGWVKSPPQRIRRLAQPLVSEHPKKRKTKYPSHFISSPFNKTWNYRQHPEPTLIISLFCKINQKAPFNTKSIKNLKKNLDISRSELQILKDLHQRGIYQLTFFLNRLIYEFSKEEYMLNLPNMPFDRLKRLLSWLPYSRTVFTSTNIHIWTYSTIETIKWLKKELGLKCTLVTIHYSKPQPKFKWFNQDTLQWNTPQVFLQKKKRRKT